MDKIGIVGAGAWGTALALTARRAGRDVVLWAHRAEVADTINATRENPVYLPGVTLDKGIAASADPATVTAADAVLLVCPAQHLRAVTAALAPHWQAGVPAVICAKGIEQGSFAMMSDIVAETLPQAPVAVLSGPTFAIEVAQGLPTAITLACAQTDLGAALVTAIGTHSFRPYLSDDLAGAQMGGAVKNVLAIACGMVEGRGLGDNARAALLTRGMAEIMRLAVTMGGRMETLMGLSGLGDLLLTATSQKSRNFSLGYALGEGKTLSEVLGGRKSVTEGVFTASSVLGLAERQGVEMPICAAVNDVLHQDVPLDDTIRALLSRPFTTELGYGGGAR